MFSDHTDNKLFRAVQLYWKILWMLRLMQFKSVL